MSIPKVKDSDHFGQPPLLYAIQVERPRVAWNGNVGSPGSTCSSQPVIQSPKAASGMGKAGTQDLAKDDANDASSPKTEEELQPRPTSTSRTLEARVSPSRKSLQQFPGEDHEAKDVSR